MLVCVILHVLILGFTTISVSSQRFFLTNALWGWVGRGRCICWVCLAVV